MGQINYIENPFCEGDLVECICEDFPALYTDKEDKSCLGKQAPVHPKKGEKLIVAEILGEFLRFDYYKLIDPPENMWYKHTNFRAVKSSSEVVVYQNTCSLEV